MLLRCFYSCIFLCFILLKPVAAKPQTLRYAENVRLEWNDYSKVIGTRDGKILIYSINVANRACFIYVFDADMNPVRKVPLPVPENAFNQHLVVSSNFIYLFYVYEEDKNFYLACKALTNEGELTGPAKIIDVMPDVVYRKSQYQSYSILGNENGSEIMVVKHPWKYDKIITLSTWLFDTKMQLEHKSSVTIPMRNWDEELREFNLDNDGNLVFLRVSDQLRRNNLIIKKKAQDTVSFIPIMPEPVFITDNVKLKIDNHNGAYVVYADCVRKKHSTESGFYLVAWDKNKQTPTFSTKTFFPESRRGDDIIVKDLKFKKESGYLVEAISRDPEKKWQLKNILVADFDAMGTMNWKVYVNSPGPKDGGIIGYNAVVTDTCIYYLYRQVLKNNVINSYLTIQGIDANGTLRDPILLSAKNGDYLRTAEGMQISKSEFVLAVQSVGYYYFGILKF